MPSQFEIRGALFNCLRETHGWDATAELTYKVEFLGYRYPAFETLTEAVSSLRWMRENNTITCLKPRQKHEVAIRNFLSLRTTDSDWMIQLDADELLQDPMGFAAWLANVDPEASVVAQWVHIWKQLPLGCLIVDGVSPFHHAHIGTTHRNAYKVGRATFREQRIVAAPQRLFHYTLVDDQQRSLALKLRSWGHAGDVNAHDFIARWHAVTAVNYTLFSNVAPFKPETTWPKLKFVCHADLEREANVLSGPFA